MQPCTNLLLDFLSKDSISNAKILVLLQSMAFYLDKLGNFGDGKGLHRNDNAVVILKTCHDTRDSRQKGLGPPFKQLEPVQSTKNMKSPQKRCKRDRRLLR